MCENDRTWLQPPHHAGIVEGQALTVEPDEAGWRLDRFLAHRLSRFSRARISGLIKAGHVTGADGGRQSQLTPSLKVRACETYIVREPAPEPAAPQPQAIPLQVTYEDDDLIVIDKPAGLVVHPGAGNLDNTLVNALLAHCGNSLSGIGGVRRPGIVHRLDKDTSGLLVVAKTDAAHKGLAAQFQTHGQDGRLERIYLAYVWGAITPSAGSIDAPIGRKPNNRTKMAVVSAKAGRHAITHYRVRERFSGKSGEVVASQIACRLETGRTHQIRVHMAHIGHPVLADPVYGAGHKTRTSRLHPSAQAALGALDRQALHAAVLAFEHPVSGEALRFESALPDEMQTLHDALSVLA